MAENYQRLGLVYAPTGTPWHRSHCQNPFVQQLSGSRYRVHFAARDEKNRSRGAWADIEVLQYSDALGILDSVTYAAGTESEKAMARAVARWRAQERNVALQDFEEAIAIRPDWTNARWVNALYSSLVAQSLQEMQVELERRRKTTAARR